MVAGVDAENKQLDAGGGLAGRERVQRGRLKRGRGVGGRDRGRGRGSGYGAGGGDRRRGRGNCYGKEAIGKGLHSNSMQHSIVEGQARSGFNRSAVGSRILLARKRVEVCFGTAEASGTGEVESVAEGTLEKR